ncbi:MAG: sulfite exporter TauE/SafE family protein [Longimicrobiales bacterium]
MEAGWGAYSLLSAVGFVAGTLNVIAGGGSFLALPVLIFLGLPATVANGTNRVAILLQNTGAVWSFRRRGVFSRRWLSWAALPALAGAGLGTWLAVEMGDRSFERVLAALMVVVTVWTIWDPVKKREPRDELGEGLGALGRWGLIAGFFLAGIYGGFVQAGVGFLILTLTTLGGLDLVRGNALKVLLILAFTPLSLALFAATGNVAWGMGLALAAGNFAGGLLGVRLTVLKGHAWVRRVVLVTVFVFAVKLWVG